MRGDGGGSRQRSAQPPCAGSAFTEPHGAELPAAYSVVCPGGTVVFCCDIDCLERLLRVQARDLRKRGHELAALAHSR